ncbi:MAG: efflux RND transporter periplasmic adaptor subunit [Xanthomonadales bacterium]|nr:efflux RND transporter periplasmic adaptor subunit [Xanthomonadales bacterium]
MTLLRIVPFMLLAALLAGCGDRHGETGHADGAGHDHAHGNGGHADDETATGVHGGRLLERDGHSVELRIVEDGQPPRWNAWLYRGTSALAPAEGTLRVSLERLGGKVETHDFAADGDRLVGNAIVAEPHSFDVTVEATVEGRPLRWTFRSHEGRTTIPLDIATQAGVKTARVGGGAIRDEHEMQGLVTPVEGRHARIAARFPGPIRSVRAGIGDDVRKGQVLAIVESNVSLSDYAITAPFAGTVIARTASAGDLAGDTPLFEIADLSSVWVDVHLFGADAQHITPGLPVAIKRLSDGTTAETTLDRVLPGTATASQSTVARATLDNADRRWRTGAAVRAHVTVSVEQVSMRVPLSALQRWRDRDVVFVRVGDVYEVRPLELGRRDGGWVEVLSGLQEGDEIVVEQSYIIKADIEKSGASHDH